MRCRPSAGPVQGRNSEAWTSLTLQSVHLCLYYCPLIYFQCQSLISSCQLNRLSLPGPFMSPCLPWWLFRPSSSVSPRMTMLWLSKARWVHMGSGQREENLWSRGDVWQAFIVEWGDARMPQAGRHTVGHAVGRSWLPYALSAHKASRMPRYYVMKRDSVCVGRFSRSWEYCFS